MRRGHWARLFSPLTNALRRLRSYAGRRKATTATLAIAFLLVAAIVGWIYLLYRVDEPQTSLELSCIDAGYELVDTNLYLKYDESKTDTLTLYLSFKTTGIPLKGKRFIIQKSPNLRPVGEPNGGVSRCESYVSKNWLCYEFGDHTSYGLVQDFEGHIFGRSAQNISLDFTLGADRYASTIELPFEVDVQGLHGVNVGSTLPEPSLRYWDGFKFRFPPKSSPNTGEILISGTDRSVIYSSQFRLFLLGTLLGILSSIIAAIVLDGVREIERR